MAGRIVAVRVAHPGTMEQHITHFKLDSGTVFTRAEMVAYVKLSPDTYYTNVEGHKAYVEVAVSSNGTEYVKTKADYTTKNNLLSLPRF